MEFLSNTSNWVLISMILCLALVYFKGRAPILKFLDSRSDKIRATLEEAERLRREAEVFLKDAQQQQQEASAIAQKITQQAQDTATRIQRDSAAKLQEDMARKEKQLIDRIARAEHAAVENVRLKAAEVATQAAELILQDALSKSGKRLVDDTIADVPVALKN